MPWQQSIYPLLIITPSGGFTGLFIYTPAPGPGNLLMSIASAPGTDPYGNTYFQGFTSRNPAGLSPEIGLYLQIQQNSLLFKSDAAASLLHFGAQMVMTDAVAAAGAPTISIVSPGTNALFNVGRAQLSLFGTSQDGTFPLAVATDVIAAWNPQLTTHNSPEIWHSMPGMSNLWSIGGHASYRLTAQGDLQVAWKDLLVGTATDGTVIWAAGSLPAAYRPGNSHRVVCYADQTRASGANQEMCALELETDGSVQCFGIGGAATRADLYATIPITD